MMIIVVVGTRPEIIKMAPIIKELQRRNLQFLFIHTGQHSDYLMSEIFINELELPKPIVSFSIQSEHPVFQIGEIMLQLGNFIKKTLNKNNIMLVQGDTNSMLASGLLALKLGIKLGHVESGLRSYDWRMPEEHNRRMIDHVSDYLFAPTKISKKILLDEKVQGKIFMTGNTIIDSLNLYFYKVEKIEENIMNKIKFESYGLITFHRAENVDDYKTLVNFVKIIKKSPIPLVFPVHPRTKSKLIEFSLWEEIKKISHLQLLPPQGYFEFLALMKNSQVVLTDSGGLQEEATYPKIRKPVLILRKSTERPEAISYGFAKLVGTNHYKALNELKRLINEGKKLPCRSPFGDGNASKRIVNVIEKEMFKKD